MKNIVIEGRSVASRTCADTDVLEQMRGDIGAGPVQLAGNANPNIPDDVAQPLASSAREHTTRRQHRAISANRLLEKIPGFLLIKFAVEPGVVTDDRGRSHKGQQLPHRFRGLRRAV